MIVKEPFNYCKSKTNHFLYVVHIFQASNVLNNQTFFLFTEHKNLEVYEENSF